MQKVVLIGSNIEHSRSPSFHNRLFEKFNLPFRYELMPVDPGDLPELITMMKGDGFRGANVTSPHKEVVYDLLDERSETVRRLRAVNTIVFEEGRARGFNTDTIGFAKSMERRSLLAAPFSAAVLGTGGGARAAIEVLLAYDTLTSLTIYSRRVGGAKEIAGYWEDNRIRVQEYECYEAADLVVHATPVGLPGCEGKLLEPVQLSGTKLLYDMIYYPETTSLMEAARKVGVPVLGGGEMFIGQGLAAFRLWTGVEARRSDLSPIPGF